MVRILHKIMHETESIDVFVRGISDERALDFRGWRWRRISEFSLAIFESGGGGEFRNSRWRFSRVAENSRMFGGEFPNFSEFSLQRILEFSPGNFRILGGEVSKVTLHIIDSSMERPRNCAF